MINAPNAILNGWAGAPISSEKFKAYSCSNSDQGINLARITQRFCSHNFPSKGNSKQDLDRSEDSTFRYICSGEMPGISPFYLFLLHPMGSFGNLYALHSLLFSFLMQTLPMWSYCHAYLLLVDREALVRLELNEFPKK